MGGVEIPPSWLNDSSLMVDGATLDQCELAKMPVNAVGGLLADLFSIERGNRCKMRVNECLTAAILPDVG